MKTRKESKLKESNSLHVEKDVKQFPESQFNKSQRKDAEKALRENEHANSKEVAKDTE